MKMCNTWALRKLCLIDSPRPVPLSVHHFYEPLWPPAAEGQVIKPAAGGLVKNRAEHTCKQCLHLDNRGTPFKILLTEIWYSLDQITILSIYEVIFIFFFFCHTQSNIFEQS